MCFSSYHSLQGILKDIVKRFHRRIKGQSCFDYSEFEVEKLLFFLILECWWKEHRYLVKVWEAGNCGVGPISATSWLCDKSSTSHLTLSGCRILQLRKGKYNPMSWDFPVDQMTHLPPPKGHNQQSRKLRKNTHVLLSLPI